MHTIGAPSISLNRQSSTAHLSRFNQYWAQMIKVANSRGDGDMGGGLTLFERAFLFLDAPSSSKQAYAFYVFLMLTITLSVTNFVVSTMTSIVYTDTAFYNIDYFCTVRQGGLDFPYVLQPSHCLLFRLP